MCIEGAPDLRFHGIRAETSQGRENEGIPASPIKSGFVPVGSEFPLFGPSFPFSVKPRTHKIRDTMILIMIRYPKFRKRRIQFSDVLNVLTFLVLVLELIQRLST